MMWDATWRIGLVLFAAAVVGLAVPLSAVVAFVKLAMEGW